MKKDLSAKMTREFTLLITGCENNDTAVRRYAGTGYDLVFHRLEYARCDERFNGIKALQRKARDSSAALGERITMSVDLSEWIGHEDEDYFTITVKFLYDMRRKWSYVFTVGSHTREQSLDIYGVLMKYMTGSIVCDNTFVSKDALAVYLTENGADTDSAKLLSAMLLRDEMKELRSYPAVNRICREILGGSDTGRITAEDVSAYLRCEDALPRFTDERISEEYAQLADSFGFCAAEENTVA